MDAIVTAGGIPQPGEPLYEFTGGKHKALLELCGKPMIQWVLDALDEAPGIDQVVVIGLPGDSEVTCKKVVDFLPNQNGLLQNLRAGMKRVREINPQASHLMIVSSDLPGITSEMAEWTIKTTMETDHDIYYSVISRQVMEARYPNSRRTYTHLKDYEVCGGDMNVIRTSIGTEKDDLWERIIASRKNPIKQASLIGFSTLFLLLLRQLTLDDTVRRVTRRLNVAGRAIVCPYAEIGMDVDKPFQLELMRADLVQRLAA